jgi:CRP-like cAMP-binding protein
MAVFDVFRRKSPPDSLPDWQRAPLFRGLDADEMAWLTQHVVHQHLQQGQVLVEEGTDAKHLYVLTSGKLEVLKRERRTSRFHRIKVLRPGDVVGEIGLLDDLPRTATVSAITDARVSGFEFSKVGTAREIYLKLISNLATLLASKLRSGSEDAVTSAHQRSAMGELIVNMLILLCVYVMLVSTLSTVGLRPSNTMFVSVPLLLVFGLGTLRFMIKSGYPARDFGLTLRQAASSLWESSLLTIALLVLATGVKGLLLLTSEDYANVPLIEFPDVLGRFLQPRVQGLASMYAVSSAVQELIVRGALQSMLERFLTGRRHRLKAIVVCALLFSVSHLHTGVLLPLLVFFPALCWGWLFSRRRNLLGVTLSHVILGSYVFFVLGVRLG